MILGSIIVSLSVPLAMLITGIVIYRAPEQFHEFMWLFVYCFAMIAYCYSPTYENDLARYYMQIDRCSTLPFSDAFTWGNDGLFVKNIIFWVLAQINQKNLLQATAIGTLYGTVGVIACDTSKQSYKNFYLVMIILIAVLPLFLATNNIRNIMAFSLLILGFYRDIVQKKRGVILYALYILPCFIHMTGFVLLGARLLLPLIKKHYKITALAVITVPFLVVNIIYPRLRYISIPGSLGLIVRRAIWKSYSTIVGTSAYAIGTHESGYNNACRVVMFFFCMISAYVCNSYLFSEDGEKDQARDFIIFDLLLHVFTCVYILTGAVKFWVFAVAAILCEIPILHKIYSGTYRCRISFLDVKLPMTVLACGRFLLEAYFMSSRVNWSEFLSNILLTNGWVIFGRILQTLIIG